MTSAVRSRRAGGSPSAVRSRLVRLADLTGRDLDSWRRLAATAVEPNLYADPAFLEPTARLLADPTQMSLLVGARGDDWLYALPWADARRDRHWPKRHASTYVGALREFSSSGTPLLASDDPDTAALELARGLRVHAGRLGGALDLCLVNPEGLATSRLLRALEEAGAATYTWRSEQRAAVRFADLPDGDWHGLLSKSARKDLRRVGRRLAADHGPVVLEDVTDDPDVAARYLDFELTSWKADPSRGAIAFALRPGGREWWTEIVAGLRASGRLRAFQLRAGDEVIYMTAVAVSSGRADGLYDVYRQSWAELSPGLLGRAMEVDRLRSTGDVDLYDTGINPSLYAYATRFYPHRLHVVSMTVAIGGPVTDWAMRGWVGTRRLARRAAERAHLR